MIKFEWKITRLECIPAFNNLTNLVVQVWYECVATNDADTKKLDGRIGIKYEEQNEFIEFENLTEEIVLSWVFSEVSKDGAEEKLAQLFELIDSTTSIPIPWNKD